MDSSDFVKDGWQAGLWLVDSGSFTTQAAANVDGIFTAKYKNYKAIFNVSAQSTTLSYSLRFRTNGSSNSGATYNYVQVVIPSSSGLQTIAAARTQTLAPIVSATASPPVAISLEILEPNLVAPTFFFGQNQASSANLDSVNGVFTASTAFDGISIIASTGTITGTYSIYGYNL